MEKKCVYDKNMFDLCVRVPRRPGGLSLLETRRWLVWPRGEFWHSWHRQCMIRQPWVICTAGPNLLNNNQSVSRSIRACNPGCENWTRSHTAKWFGWEGELRSFHGTVKFFKITDNLTRFSEIIKSFLNCSLGLFFF